MAAVVAAAPQPKRAVLSEWRLGAASVVSGLAAAASPAIAGFADPLGNSPLTIAIESGNLDAVSALLGKSPPPTLAGAILVAAAFNRHQLIPVLVRHGADVRETDASGASALHRAADNDHVEVVKLLLEMGCPVDSRDKLHRTPLHLAVAANAVQCVVALLKAGADITAVDDLGHSAGDMGEALRSGAGAGRVDDESLAAIMDLFKDVLMQAHILQPDEEGERAMAAPTHVHGAAEDHDAGGAAAATAVELTDATGEGDGEVEVPEMTADGAEAAELGDGAVAGGVAAPEAEHEGPIVGIHDIDTLVVLLLAKVRASVEQGIVASFDEVYHGLDTAGDGHCNGGDLASGVLEMGIKVEPELVPALLERISGRPGATTVTAAEFVHFCGLTAEEAAAVAAEAAAQAAAAAAAAAAAGEGSGGVEAQQAEGMAAPEGDQQEWPEAIVQLATDLRERLRVGVENSEQDDYTGFFRVIHPSGPGTGGDGFDAHELQSAAELLGLGGTVDDFAAVIEMVWGLNHVGERPLYMRIGLEEFLAFTNMPDEAEAEAAAAEAAA